MKFRILVLIIFGLACELQAQVAVQITDDITDYSAGPLVQYFEDKPGELAWNEVQQKPFVQNNSDIPNFGWSKSAFWFKFQLEDRRVTKTDKLILEIGWPLFDKLDVYFLDPTGAIVKECHTGDTAPLGSKEIKNTNFIFQIPAQSKLSVLIRTQAEDTIQIPIHIWHNAAFYESHVMASLCWGIFFGIIILMFIYCVFMGLFLKDSIYLFYSLYLISMCLFELSYSGIGYTYVWGAFPRFQNISLPLSMAVFYILSTHFTQKFLNIRETIPFLRRHFNIFIGICALSIPLCFFVSPMTMGIVLNVMVFYGGGLILLSSFMMVLRGYQPARYFLAAWTFYVAGGLLLVSKDFLIVESNNLTNFAIHFGFMFQIILFLLAIADRVYLIKIEREKYLSNYLKEQEKALATQKIENEESQRRLKITETYTRRSIVEAIKNGDDPTVYLPTSKNLTVLFSDIRDFTGISENLNPIETVDLLNFYFNEMNETIIVNDGEIDKLIGDCIMALFTDPDRSVQAAIQMRRKLIDINRDSKSHIRINNGVGINYGEVVLGNIGSNAKMDFTVIGDIVNSASRIEALTKFYGLSIIISDDLKNVLKNEYQSRFVDTVLVKGKKFPVKIFEVFDFDKPEIVDLKLNNQTLMDEAFQYYKEAEFEKALNIYSNLISESGRHAYRTDCCADPLLDFYRHRCSLLMMQRKTGALSDWDGIYEFNEK